MSSEEFVAILTEAAQENNVANVIRDVIYPSNPVILAEENTEFLERRAAWFTSLTGEQVDFLLILLYRSAASSLSEVFAALDGAAPLWSKLGEFQLSWTAHSQDSGEDSESATREPSSLSTDLVLLRSDEGPQLHELYQYDFEKWREIVDRYNRGEFRPENPQK